MGVCYTEVLREPNGKTPESPDQKKKNKNRYRVVWRKGYVVLYRSKAKKRNKRNSVKDYTFP